ncbi:MAG TPA: pilus assembly protein [Candidatus Paenibacillus intestinavium]|nr:pilus assembly protein [Candidatus Paenibacillus intestinavium]
MKKQILSLHPIKISQHRKHKLSALTKNEAGSITVEAALVMPIFILFLFVFYLLLMTISAQMALQATAASSVQQLSAHMHPIALMVNELKDRTGSHTTIQYDNADEGWKKTVYDISEVLPAPIDSLVQEGLKGNWWPAANLAGTILGKDILDTMIQSQVSSPVLQKDKVELAYLQLPDLINYTDLNVTLALEYELPIKIPLFNQAITIREQAVQRVWIPDVRPSYYEINEAEDAYIYVVSLTPNPVKPGRKATLKIITLPNTKIDLGIVYKSGSSVAKHLGEVISNDKGEAEWTWHVSGNTTVGSWNMNLSLPEQSYQIEQIFNVAKSK